ncbi:hypothetical protein D3C72_2418410 [compost metagenome]
MTDWPGLRNSALPQISQPVSAETRLRRISGVLPMAEIRSLCLDIGAICRGEECLC